jgi:hypothetical protein
MRRSNFALRLQRSLLEELRKAAEVEGVALNQLINVAVAEKVSALRTEEYFRERGRRADRAETLRILERAGQGNTPVKAMNFPRSGGRSQAAKRRMREIRPNGDRRKGSLLNSGAALRRQPRSCWWMSCRRLKGGGDAFALLHLGLTSFAASLHCGPDSRKTGYSETINDPILWAVQNAIKEQRT